MNHYEQDLCASFQEMEIWSSYIKSFQPESPKKQINPIIELEPYHEVSTEYILRKVRLTSIEDYQLKVFERMKFFLNDDEIRDCVLKARSLFKRIKELIPKYSTENFIGLYIPCLVIACKFESDFAPSMKWFAANTAVPLKKLVNLERFVLEKLNYNLF